MTPAGVWMASATQSGMLCVTRMNSIVNGPTVTPSRGRTACTGVSSSPCSRSFASTMRKRQRRAVDRPVDVRHHVRHAADVVLVAVRQHEGRGAPFLLQVGEVRDDPVHAEQFGVREHDAGIDHDGRLTPGERQHVHAELAKSAKRYDLEHFLWAHAHGPAPLRPWQDDRVDGSRSLAARSGSWARLKNRGGMTDKMRRVNEIAGKL